MNQHSAVPDRPVGEHASMCRDPRNAKAGPELVADIPWQIHRHHLGNHRESGRGAKGTVGLRTPHPDALTDARGGNAVAHLVDHARAVAVGDDAGEGHAVPERVLALLCVAGVDPGEGEAHPNLAGARVRGRHVPVAQHA